MDIKGMFTGVHPDLKEIGVTEVRVTGIGIPWRPQTV